MRWFDSFLKGVSRIVDPFSRSPEVQAILDRSDADAIRSDWLTVVEDWRKTDPPTLSHYTDAAQLVATWKDRQGNT